MNYERECDVAREAGEVAAQILLSHYRDGTTVWEKKKDDPVTQADLDADAAIRQILSAALPEDAILSEETADSPERLKNRRVWIVDPMDGTREFSNGVPEFCTSIALVDDGEPVVAVIANPAAATVVWAVRCGGAFRNGERVRVNEVRELDRARVIASRSEIKRGQFDRHRSWFASLTPVGSIAWKLACVASGDADLNVSFAPKNEWDVCAGDLLVREAGGTYEDFSGGTRRYNQPDPLIESNMVAGCPSLVRVFCAREAREAAS
ncbi:MAG: 3'(2'),5'-bisphosphate nucleotidase CysQ [Myxococcales bacterium]|nr:3'(2'),5'-bisphosphate nucleotidase CysQ [Myxococcales bacterium]